MNGYEILVDTPVCYAYTGKFQSPSREWKHIARNLSDFELIVMTSGILYIGSNQTKHVVKKGEYLLVPPNTHQFGYEASDCSFYWLHFEYKNMVTVLDLNTTNCIYCVNRIVIPQTGTLKNLEKIIVMMKQLQDCVKSYHEKTISDYMTTTILLELYNQLSLFETSPSQNKKHQVYNDLIDYIKWNCHENLKVSQIADYFGYNEKYLSHLFTLISGTSLKQYILQQKMEAAKFILSDTNFQIRDIATQIGYSDCHNFMKSFKKIVGLTPTEYRNAYAKRLLFYK